VKYSLEIVTNKPELWRDSDPVRPELGVSFKTYPGREVFGLKNKYGEYVAFCCVAKTLGVPSDIMSLSTYTAEDGVICVPYTVWSLKRGSGKAIINSILHFVKSWDKNITRVVTLSPLTEMARSFHIRNGAREISTNMVSANFEYPLGEAEE
tara:strand:+ start:71 stop:526 length:456 start_codon:yes stop_codon:yes gene_type:complete